MTNPHRGIPRKSLAHAGSYRAVSIHRARQIGDCSEALYMFVSSVIVGRTAAAMPTPGGGSVCKRNLSSNFYMNQPILTQRHLSGRNRCTPQNESVYVPYRSHSPDVAKRHCINQWLFLYKGSHFFMLKKLTQVYKLSCEKCSVFLLL